MMGAAMLQRHQFVWSLWALYRLVVSSITWGSQAQPLLFQLIFCCKAQPHCASLGYPFLNMAAHT